MTKIWPVRLTSLLLLTTVLLAACGADLDPAPPADASERFPAPIASTTGDGDTRVTLTLGRAVYVAAAHGQALQTVTLTGTGAPVALYEGTGPGIAILSRLSEELVLEADAVPGVSLLSQLDEELELEVDAVGKWGIELVAVHRQNATEERFFLPGPDFPSSALVGVFDLSGAVRILVKHLAPFDLLLISAEGRIQRLIPSEETPLWAVFDLDVTPDIYGLAIVTDDIWQVAVNDSDPLRLSIPEE